MSNYCTKYDALYSEMLGEIANGVHEVGARLPSVKSIMQRKGMSQATVMKAVEMLARDGLLKKRRGVGLFVARREPAGPAPIKVCLDGYALDLWEGIRDGDAALAGYELAERNGAQAGVFRAGGDVVTVTSMECAAATDRGETIPLDQYMDKDALMAERMAPEALDIYRRRGQLWAIPLCWAPLAAHLNLDLFEKEGVPPPKPGWTYDDLIETCRAFAERGVEQPLAWGDQAHFHAACVFAHGGRLCDPKTMRFHLDSRETLHAFEQLRRLARAATPPWSRDHAAMLRSFAEGRHPILLWWMTRRGERLSFRRTTLPLPGARNTVATSSGLAVSSRSTSPDRAWEFIRAMTSPAASQWMARRGWLFPATRVGLIETMRRDPGVWPLLQKLGEIRPELCAMGAAMIRVIDRVMDGWWQEGTDLAMKLRLAQDALTALHGAESGLDAEAAGLAGSSF